MGNRVFLIFTLLTKMYSVICLLEEMSLKMVFGNLHSPIHSVKWMLMALENKEIASLCD